jgi:ribonuclease VapC
VIAVDTSAIVAILKQENDADRLARAITKADGRIMSALNYLEACIVMVGRGTAEAAVDVDDLLQRARIDIVPLDHELSVEARAAFVRFGKGRHPAGLNLADCASYALARKHDVPLLYKGDDFSRTDVDSALT